MILKTSILSRLWYGVCALSLICIAVVYHFICRFCDPNIAAHIRMGVIDSVKMCAVHRSGRVLSFQVPDHD